ncbi:MAG TPA: tRNA (adenosine(37)-N6)-threonylcarbamoyltransferase complex dimerization subunit type 1 TsaB [Pyrinomonadaceae bacterium]
MGQFSTHIPKEPLILSLETATRAGSLALLRGDTPLASSKGVAQESHSVNLLAQIEALLREANVSLSDIELYATAAGPGSFTGLRIGLATIKAFAATFKRPCIGVPTLSAIAFAAGISRRTCALLPAGRGEVFAQLFSVSPQMIVSPLNKAEHIPPQALLERLNDARTLRWAGAGAQLYAHLIRERARELEISFEEQEEATSPAMEESERWTLAPDVQELAEPIARLALQRTSDNERHGAEDLRAIYVRPSDAELNTHVKG